MRVLLVVLLAACGDVHRNVDSASCGSCHVKQFEQWQQSPHASSGTSATFQSMLPRVESSWGHVARARCESCHQPALGIGCATCHLAVGNRGTSNGAVEIDVDAPIATVRKVNAPHETATRGFLKSPTLCGTCHEVKGPRLIDEPTFSEFMATAPPDEVTCQSCHFAAGHQTEKLDGLELAFDETSVTVTNVRARHDVPTGMTVLRDVRVEVTLDDGTVVRAIELGAQMDAAFFTDATFIRNRGLHFGETRSWSAPMGRTILEASVAR